MPIPDACLKGSVIIIFLIFVTSATFSQSTFYQPVTKAYNSVKIPNEDTALNHKNFGRAAIEFGFAELTPWSFDHFIAKKDYSNISFNTARHNLNPGNWQFDNDPFTTNQFGHPYHGNIFFSTFRTNGYTFWQAVPATFAGSYLWETFAENQPPAPNDFINTSFGGIVLGEMSYRLANKIVNNQATGMHRQLSELIALLVSPANGLNRIIDGKWGKVYGNPSLHDSSKVSAQFDLGFRQYNITSNNPFHNTIKGWYGHARLLYGEPDQDYKTPFSNFVVNVEVGKDDSSAMNVVSVYGSLVGWDFSWEGKSQQLLVLSANYDYIHNEDFFYGGQSVRANWISKYTLTKKATINTVFGAGPVLLAAVPDPYMFRGRDYDYGSGLGFNASGTLTLFNKLTYTLSYRGSWTTTINGNRSYYFLHTANSELSYMFVKDFSVCAELGYYALQGNYYKKHPDRDEHYPFFKAALRYNVNF